MREEGTGRPRQSQPPGESGGGGGKKPEKTPAGPLAFTVALEENIPRLIHHEGWEPWRALMGGVHPEGPGLPGKGRSALPRPSLPPKVGGGTRKPEGCGRQNWIQTQPNHFLNV